MERYRFNISDGDSFQHVGEGAYASPVAAEAHAIQVARELSEDDTWHGSWISVEDTRGNREGADRHRKAAHEVGSRSAECDQKIEHVDPAPRRGGRPPGGSAD